MKVVIMILSLLSIWMFYTTIKQQADINEQGAVISSLLDHDLNASEQRLETTRQVGEVVRQVGDVVDILTYIVFDTITFDSGGLHITTSASP